MYCMRVEGKVWLICVKTPLELTHADLGHPYVSDVCLAQISRLAETCVSYNHSISLS